MRLLRAAALALAPLLAHASIADAQATGPVHLRLVSRRAIGPLTPYDSLGLTGIHKPNGRMYRLRESIPAKLPEYVPREVDHLPLAIADATADGWLAFHRSPPEATGARNSRFGAILYGADGTPKWKLSLNDFLSRPDHVEITDVRYVDGKLYFNESCQSYSREAGGRCSSLVRVDPVGRRVEWRTPPLVSNGVFFPAGAWIVAGYGFTGERDHVSVIDRRTGRILATTPLDSAPDYYEMKNGRLYVTTYRSLYEFQIVPGVTPR